MTRGPETGAYYHPQFKKGSPKRIMEMSCINAKQTQQLQPMDPIALGMMYQAGNANMQAALAQQQYNFGATMMHQQVLFQQQQAFAQQMASTQQQASQQSVTHPSTTAAAAATEAPSSATNPEYTAVVVGPSAGAATAQHQQQELTNQQQQHQQQELTNQQQQHSFNLYQQQQYFTMMMAQQAQQQQLQMQAMGVAMAQQAQLFQQQQPPAQQPLEQQHELLNLQFQQPQLLQELEIPLAAADMAIQESEQCPPNFVYSNGIDVGTKNETKAPEDESLNAAQLNEYVEH